MKNVISSHLGITLPSECLRNIHRLRKRTVTNICPAAIR